ncbi:hypothetical protein NA57DRAFT_76074 [Rhizodiscina lignyota]|uniref:CENP-V/GFA domain-containing protein n=1 Tax=Rhizodiscina lignyota TaxID=1504668 RepID=A0A9P4IIK1_9PEZI|nr:hypothetical protein NA57DRAFT_76074 [Rhizodiscina lignyota]
MSLSGTCLCGAITITINDSNLLESDAQRGHICHCRNCRAWGGCIAASILKISSSLVTIEGAEHLTTYEDSATLSGNTIQRKFCGRCGSPILKLTPRSPDDVDVHLGLFKQIPKPEFEMFCSRRQEWEGGVQYPARKKFEELPGSKEVV